MAPRGVEEHGGGPWCADGADGDEADVGGAVDDCLCGVAQLGVKKESMKGRRTGRKERGYEGRERMKKRRKIMIYQVLGKIITLPILYNSLFLKFY